MWDKAVFACKNSCGRRDLSYKELLDHMRDECPNRKILCPNNCGASIPVAQEAHHKATACANEKIPCHQCGKVFLLRYQMKEHLRGECTHSKGNCHDCGAIYEISEDQH